MKLSISATSLAIQVIVVSWTIIKRDIQHNRADNSEPIRSVYDYIVVGAGSAGAVVARRLSDNRKGTVLLLEAGGPQSFVNDVPGIEQTIQKDPEFNWNYQILPQKNIGLGRAQPGVFRELKGRVLGGSSTINRMQYLRPNRRDFDEWEKKFGAKGWGFDEVLPFFIKSENNTDYNIVSKNPGFHGTDGPLGVASDPNLDLFLRDVQKAYNSFGFPTLDVNGPRQAGTAIVQLNIKDGYRSSTANAFLEPNPNPKSLFISLYSLATKVMFSEVDHKLVATGVQFVKNKRKYAVIAKHEVILCGGSYNSPQLLMLSGIGPKEHLNQMQIPVLLDLPVGENLHDHPKVQFWAPILNNTPIEAFPEMSIRQLHQLITTGRGPLASSTALYTYFHTKSNPNKDWANIVLSNGIMSVTNNITELTSVYSAQRAQEWTEYFKPYLGRPVLSLDVFLRRPISTGFVRLASNNPFTAPLIDPAFLQYELEMDDMVEAVKFELFFVQNSKISKNVVLIPKAISGCSLCKDRPIYECDSYIRCYIREFGAKEHHSGGTCKMGDPKRNDTVVNPRLRVKHVQALRVCDASVIPKSPNGNTNAVTIMIGERCAHFIQEERHSKN